MHETRSVRNLRELREAIKDGVPEIAITGTLASGLVAVLNGPQAALLRLGPFTGSACMVVAPAIVVPAIYCVAALAALTIIVLFGYELHAEVDVPNKRFDVWLTKRNPATAPA